MRVPRYGALQSKFQDTQFLLITSASGPGRRWIGAYPGQGHIRKCHKVPWTCAAAWSSPVARRTTWPVAGERPTSGSVVGLFPLLELLDLLQELCLLVEALRFCPEFSRGLVLGAWRSGHGFSSIILQPASRPVRCTNHRDAKLISALIARIRRPSARCPRHRRRQACDHQTGD